MFTKPKTRKIKPRKNNKTIKVTKGIFLKSTTPPEVAILSDQINAELNTIQ